MTDPNERRRLISGFIDKELTADEMAEVTKQLGRSDPWRQEYEELLEASAHLAKLSVHEPSDIVLDQLWRKPYSRWSWRSGLFLVLGGWIVLILFSLYALIESLLTDSEEPLVPRIAVAGIIIGFIILFASVLRERIHTYSTDPYKEIKR